MSVYFTDTDCELWYKDVDKYKINLIKMPYTIDGEEDFYDMGRTDKYKTFIDKMRAGSTPITSALNPDNYMEYFEPYFAKGEDILYIHFSNQMSGTFNYMNMALNQLKEKYPERKVKTFDTKSICMGGGFQALEAAKMHQAGKSDEEILEFLSDFTKHVNMSFAVDSLVYLKRGGRISQATAVFGGILNIKPILKFNDEGCIAKAGNGKGMKNAVTVMVNELLTNIEKLEEYPIYILDADNKPMSEYAKHLLQEKLGEKCKIEQYPIGPVICAHCGPGTVGIIYYGKKRI